MSLGIEKAAIRMVRDYVQDMEASTENLANATMPGYKRITLSRTQFSEQLNKQVEGDSAKVMVDHEQGAMRETGRSLDFAIEGEGYFVVSDGENEYYTRNGAFHLSQDGSIVNSRGMKLQGTSGSLRMPVGGSVQQLHLGEDRQIQVGERVIGQLKLVNGTPAELNRVGNTLFNSDQPLDGEGEGSVLSGYLEQSNATIVDEMVTMMTTLRNYESCQKMLKTADDIQSRMIGKLA